MNEVVALGQVKSVVHLSYPVLCVYLEVLYYNCALV